MTTVKQSDGNSLKETINESRLERKQQETLSVIRDFLAENENVTNSIAWHLHVFCRTGKGEDFDYSHDELEETVWFLDWIIQVFMHPKASKLYCEISEGGADVLAEKLHRLRALFASLSNCDVTDARLEEIELRYVGDLSEEQLHNTKVRFQRLAEIEAMKKATIEKYMDRFNP